MQTRSQKSNLIQEKITEKVCLVFDAITAEKITTSAIGDMLDHQINIIHVFNVLQIVEIDNVKHQQYFHTSTTMFDNLCQNA